jgi:hypothetical protein
MTMPGFSADACLYEPNGFHMAGSEENSASFSKRLVVPAWPLPSIVNLKSFAKLLCRYNCYQRCLEKGNSSPHGCDIFSIYCCYYGQDCNQCK